MRTSVAALGVAAITAIAAACHTDEATGQNHMCKTDVSGITSPGPGIITLAGNFYHDESVIVRAGSVTVGSATPATDRTAFTFINVPSGTQSIDIIVSCSGGQDHVGTTTVVVK